MSSTHSQNCTRAREAKTTPCTEVPHSKSLSRVEIWLTIYETCDRLESFTRDPMKYKGSPFDLYEFCDSSPLQKYDPMGLEPGSPACTACDLGATLCFTLAAVKCAFDLIEAAKCTREILPSLEFEFPNPKRGCPPIKRRIWHPCSVIQPPGTPARALCCLSFAASRMRRIYVWMF